MKNQLAAWGVFGLATAVAAVACSTDDGPVPQGPAASGSGGGGNSAGGTTTAGSTSAGTTTGGTPSMSGSSTGGTNASGSSTGGTNASGSSAGGMVSLGGQAGASPGGEAGVAGAVDGGAAGAGGAAGGDDEVVTLTPTTCGYTEVESNSSQDTSLDATSDLQVICGKLDVGHFSAADGLLDKDTYAITVADDYSLLRLELPTFAGLERIELTFDNTTIVIKQPVSVFNLTSFGGPVLLRLSGYSAANLPVSIPYQLSVVGDDVDTRCAQNQDAAAFSEIGDGADNRGNDVYHFADDVPALTAASDSAEATGITVAQASYRIDGVSADVTRVGDYFDGDSYAFHTGATTTQITLRSDWTGDRDLNLFVLKAGALVPAGSGTAFRTSSPEYATLRVRPNTNYVAFVGAFSGDLPVDYSLTLCGETYGFNGP